MLTPPAGLPVDALTQVLAEGWALRVRTLEYLPVGWGSHHWAATGHDGARWFVTVDDLAARRQHADEPLDAALSRLAAALSAAHALREAGRDFVVAPVPATAGQLVHRIGDHALALYPQVDGDSFDFDHLQDTDHAAAVLDMVIAVHGAPARVRGLAPVDDFTIPHRDQVEAALVESDGSARSSAAGPYALEVAGLVSRHATAIRSALARYDELVAEARSAPSRAVLTHGEPHPGNTMRTADGWRLIDWDTARVAPPERDLWSLDPGDGTMHAAYADGTGTTLRAELLELYRRRWDLADVAVDVARFRRPHEGTAEDTKALEILRAQVAGLD